MIFTPYFFYVFQINSIYVAKLDALTLEILQKIPLPRALYIGGMLVHGNGHVYAVHGNKMYTFWNGDLYNSTVHHIPTSLNGHLVQTNGMLVTQDGYLVVKQWSFILEDLLLYFYASPAVLKGLVAAAVIIGTSFLVSKIMRTAWNKLTPRRSSRILITSSVRGVVLTAVGFMLFIMAFVQGSYNPLQFLLSNTLLSNGGGGGELKLLDPITMEVVANAKFPERCSFARMAMITLDQESEQSPSEDAIVLLGDEYVYQFRWQPDSRKLYPVENWTRRYRTRGDGSYPGTGPAIINDVVFFTDNTYPIALSGRTYKMFRLPLKPENGVPHASPPAVEGIHLTEESPGFMFWSVVVSPIVGDVIVWDTVGRSVQSRRQEDLSLHWEIKAYQGDCLSVAADKGHVYMTDYSVGAGHVDNWLPAMTASWTDYRHTNKYFIVADTATGNILCNITISENEGMNPALVVPGGHNDVILSSRSGLTRIYV